MVYCDGHNSFTVHHLHTRIVSLFALNHGYLNFISTPRVSLFINIKKQVKVDNAKHTELFKFSCNVRTSTAPVAYIRFASKIVLFNFPLFKSFHVS